jgi:hypothetical protein
MKAFIFILGLAVVIWGCKKTGQAQYQSRGVITGYDLRLCPFPLCGGMFINIHSDTAKNGLSYYKINSSLQQLGISDSTKFPINVELNWKPDTLPFSKYNYILVTKIKVIN